MVRTTRGCSPRSGSVKTGIVTICVCKLQPIGACPPNSTQRWQTCVMQAYANSTSLHHCAGSLKLVTCRIAMSRGLQHFKTIMCLTFRVGVERSRVAVQFRDVSFEAEVLVGSAGLPSVSNTFKTWAQVMQNPPCLNPASQCSKRVRPLLSWELQSPYKHPRRYSRQQVSQISPHLCCYYVEPWHAGGKKIRKEAEDENIERGDRSSESGNYQNRLQPTNLACLDLRISAVIHTTLHTVLRCCVCCASPEAALCCPMCLSEPYLQAHKQCNVGQPAPLHACCVAYSFKSS